jgi:hypothetical protein
MHPESATVVVRKLLQSPRPVTGTDRALRQPRVDDQGAVVRIIDADRRTVECVDSSGRTLWLGDLHVMSSPRRSSTGPFSLQRSAPAPIAQRETVLAVCTWSQPTAIRTRQLQTAASSPCGIPTDRPASPRSRAAGSHRVASVAVAPAGQRRYVSPMQTSAPCRCREFAGALESLADVRTRCEAADAIAVHLREVATNADTWVSVLRCEHCTQLWAREYAFSEHHGGGLPCLYQISTTDPERWPASTVPLARELRRAGEDAQFLADLGPEVGPESCRRTDCSRKRISHSVLCRSHHFESIVGRPAPKRDVAARRRPPGRPS